jgi:hypothetical protein
MSQNDSMSDRRLVEEGLLVIVFLSRYLDCSKPTVPSESEVTQLFVEDSQSKAVVSGPEGQFGSGVYESLTFRT